MESITLRDYQNECLQAIRRAGPGRHLIVMATGLGKTVVFSRIPHEGRMLILSHRDELVHQPVRYFDEPVGIEQAGVRSNGERVVSASVQTLSRPDRLHMFHPGDFQTIVTDEAHHATAATYRRIIDWLKPETHLGFTATPDRSDGRGLDEVFDDIIYRRDLQWAIRHHWLTDIDCMQVRVDWNMDELRKGVGDFQQASIARTVDSPQANTQLAAALEQAAVGQTLVFAGSLDHARRLANLIPDSEIVDGATPHVERRRIIDDFTHRRFRTLINYGVFVEGTDLPLIETIMIARPVGNAALYRQMVGRGLRPSPGKNSLKLIDAIGVTTKYRLVTAASLIGVTLPSNAPAELTEGSLTDMTRRVEQWLDSCPAGWLIRLQSVNLLDDRVAWQHHADGSRTISIEDARLTVSTPDPLGHVTLLINRGGRPEGVFDLKTFDDADDAAYQWLARHQSQARALWDSERMSLWADEPSSKAQRARIRSTYSKDELKDVNVNRLTKREAGMLIDRRPRPATVGQVTYLTTLAGRHPKTAERLLAGRRIQDLDAGECSHIINMLKNADYDPFAGM